MRSLVLGAAVLAATFFSYEGWQTVKNLTENHTIIQELEVQTLEAKWTDASGVEHIVKTPRNENESVEDWADRHKEAVDALKALYPPAT